MSKELETTPQSTKPPVRLSIKFKAITAVITISLLVVLASSITGYFLRKAVLLEELRDLNLSIAGTGAIGIFGDDLDLIRSNEDVYEPEFEFVKERLEKIRDVNGLKNEEIYILRPLELDKFTTEFVVMPGDKPFVGNVYIIRPENRAAFLTAIQEGRNTSTEIYEDEHGTWISAYAPIFNREGKVSAILEVDAEIDRYLDKIYETNQQLVKVLAVGAGTLLIALVPGIFLVNRLSSRLGVLKEALNTFDAEDSDAHVDLKTGDELEDVADAFNNMASSLAESQENLRTSNAALKDRTVELNGSLALTSTIMETVQNGLMLITPDGKIESGYSTSNERIFERKNLHHIPFSDLLRDRVPKQTYDLTVRFLKLLFNETKANHLLPKINPLKEVEVLVDNSMGQAQTKFLSFNFDRVWSDKKIVQALVIVEDITPRIKLSRELKESAARLERQGELLFSVIHVEPATLDEFITTSRNQLDTICNQLSKSIDTKMSMEERETRFSHQIEEIFRRVHLIKGEAALLKIDYYENAAHEFETKLQGIREKGNLDGNDFIPVVLELSKMIQSFDDMTEVINRIKGMYGGASSENGKKKDTDDPHHFRDLVTELAKRHDKKATLTSNDLKLTQVPEEHRGVIRDTIIQLLRNSVVHGLESTGVRVASGKSETGFIKIDVVEESAYVKVTYTDDGKGLNYERIITRAQELDASSSPGLLNTLIDHEKDQWHVDKLNELIFKSGFSTASETSKDAGRGVGLDAVKMMIDDIGGRINLYTEPGSYCFFVIDIPK
ncbi:MAG: ATP-binding protein [Verrucomicrobiota bacterium]